MGLSAASHMSSLQKPSVAMNLMFKSASLSYLSRSCLSLSLRLSNSS